VNYVCQRGQANPCQFGVSADGKTMDTVRQGTNHIRDQAQSIPWMWFPELLLEDVWHHPQAYATFAKYVPRNSSVLEIGFGSGRILTQMAKRRECRCVGVDIDRGAFPSLAFFSKHEQIAASGILGSGFSLPFKDGAFDVVYSEGVIEHFSPEDSRLLLAEHVRACRTGGLVIVSVPNRFAVFHSLTKAILGRRFLFFPERSLSVFACSRALREAGTKIIACDGFAFGCQFYDFKVFVLDPRLPARWRKRLLAPLHWMRAIGLYHFDLPWLNALFGFQVLVVGIKQ